MYDVWMNLVNKKRKQRYQVNITSYSKFMAPTIKRTPIHTRSKIVSTPKGRQSSKTNKATEMEEQLERLKEELASFADLRNTVEQLQAQQIANTQLANEVALLKLQNEQQKQALQQIQNPGQPAVINNEQISVSELIASLQRNHIDTKAPEFSNEEATNPIEYLENLENYFKLKMIREECKMSIIESEMSGRAKIWWEASKDTINTYNNFKEAFKNKFYSIPIQVKIKTKWSSKRYNTQEGSLQTYFFKQLKEARYLRPKLEQFEINYTIIQQLPQRIRNILATVNMSDVKAIEQALSHLDVNWEEKSNNRQQSQGSNNQANNWQTQNNQQQRSNFSANQQNNYPIQSMHFAQPNYQISSANFSPNSQYHVNHQASLNNQTYLPNVSYPPPHFAGTSSPTQLTQMSNQNNTNSVSMNANRSLN